MQGLWKDKFAHYKKDKFRATYQKFYRQDDMPHDTLRYEKNMELIIHKDHRWYSINLRKVIDMTPYETNIWLTKEEFEEYETYRINTYKFNECMTCPRFHQCDMPYHLAYKKQGANRIIDKKIVVAQDEKNKIENNYFYCRQKEILIGKHTYKLWPFENEEDEDPEVKTSWSTSKLYYKGKPVQDYEIEAMYDYGWDKLPTRKQERRMVKQSLKADPNNYENLNFRDSVMDEEYRRSRPWPRERNHRPV